jgi:TPP-dependent pyruvate/acetoin dehydrogenase alpha subunit
MFAIGATTIQQFFAQLYAHADVVAEPNSAGRQMNSHFATRLLNDDGTWRDQTQLFNSAADLSPTASQMPRLVGLGYASRLYRELDDLKHLTLFSRGGDEVAFGTIGNASTAEGHFWETVNAIGVLRLPVVISIWDDEYGISVPNIHQITKGNLSEVLSGFRRDGRRARRASRSTPSRVGTTRRSSRPTPAPPSWPAPNTCRPSSTSSR